MPMVASVLTTIQTKDVAKLVLAGSAFSLGAGGRRPSSSRPSVSRSSSDLRPSSACSILAGFSLLSSKAAVTVEDEAMEADRSARAVLGRSCGQRHRATR